MEDDNILGTLLGEIGVANSASTSSSSALKVPEPVIKPARIIKSFKKINDESEDEVKKYMENFGKNLKRSTKEESEKQMGDVSLRFFYHNTFT